MFRIESDSASPAQRERGCGTTGVPQPVENVYDTSKLRNDLTTEHP